MLQVAPFAPHRPNPLGVGQMGNTLVRQAMVDEMGLVKNRMIAIRGYFYHDVNKLLSPAVEKLMSLRLGQPLDLLATDVSNVLPSVRSVATLLKASRLYTPCISSPPARPRALLRLPPALVPSNSHKVCLYVG